MDEIFINAHIGITSRSPTPHVIYPGQYLSPQGRARLTDKNPHLCADSINRTFPVSYSLVHRSENRFLLFLPRDLVAPRLSWHCHSRSFRSVKFSFDRMVWWWLRQLIIQGAQSKKVNMSKVKPMRAIDVKSPPSTEQKAPSSK